MERPTSLGLAETFDATASEPPPPRVPEQRGPEARSAKQPNLEERLEAVAAVTRAICRGGASDDLLHLIADQARRLGDAATAMVLLPEGSSQLRVRAVEGADADLLHDIHLPVHASLAGQVLRGGEARNLPDVSRERDAHSHLVVAGRLGPSMLVPLTVRAHVVGVLAVANHRGARPFTDEQFQTLRVFAAQVGLGLEARLSANVTLLDAVSLQRRNPVRRSELQLLSPAPVEMGKLLHQTLDRLARTVVELTRVHACTIHLLDPERSLRTGGAFGIQEDLVGATTAAFHLGAAHPALEAVTTEKPVVAVNERERLLADSRLRSVHDLVRAAPWDAACCLPLVTETGIRGAVCYYFSAEQRPDEGDARLIRAMAAQAATVVDNAQLLAVANEMVAIEERRHLARELHDSVSQALYGIALGARATLEHLDHDPGRAREPVKYILQLAETGLAEMRALIFELRADSLETEGLPVALARQAEAVRARSGIEVEVSVEGLPDSAIETKQALYRIGQEALQNAAKHASAHHVRLRLGSDDGRLTLEVSDDGRGFDPEGHFPGHLGLQSMQERAAALGGTLQISSRPGAGTRVRAAVPRAPKRGGLHH